MIKGEIGSLATPTSKFQHSTFYGQQQQRSQTNNSGYRGSTQKFTSTGRGFQAQQSKDSSQAYNSSPASAQRRPPPPGERRMTPYKREKYRDQ